MQSKNAWRKEPRKQVFCAQQASGGLRPLSLGSPAELRSLGSTCRDVFPESCCMWEQVSESLIHPLSAWRLEKKGKNWVPFLLLWQHQGGTNNHERKICSKQEWKPKSYFYLQKTLQTYCTLYSPDQLLLEQRVCPGAMKITQGKRTFYLMRGLHFSIE